MPQKIKEFMKKLPQTLWGGENKRVKRLALCCVLLLILLTLALSLTLGEQILTIVGNPAKMKIWLEQYHGWSKAVFVAVRTAQTVVKLIPAEPLEIGAGFAFGIWGGTAYCLLGSVLGSLMILFLTRRFGLKAVTLFVSEEKINSMRFLQNQKRVFTLLFFLYLIPSTPKDIITYLIGITRLNVLKFMLITSVARIPSIVTSTWCGYEIVTQDYKGAILVFVLTTVTALLGTLIYRQMEKRMKKNAAGETV